MLRKVVFGMFVLSTSVFTLDTYICRCFPHIVNLACQAVIAAIEEESVGECFAGVDGNPIDLARDLIRMVCHLLIIII
jgi:hypothetical protein